jgi:hypothetical protein
MLYLDNRKINLVKSLDKDRLRLSLLVLNYYRLLKTIDFLLIHYNNYLQIINKILR